MKKRIRTAPEAAKRIHLLGEKKILLFLDEVSLGLATNLADYLPAVHGFRLRSEAGVKHQKHALAKRLSSQSGGSESDLFGLYVMWRAWAWEQLGDADVVYQLLEDLEDVLLKLPKPQNTEASEVIQTGVHTFLSSLKQLSLDNKCSREKITRLMEFGPVVVDDAGQLIIASCKSESEVARDRTITDLPDRLQADEQDIQSIKERLGELSTQAKAITAKWDVIEQTSDAHIRSLRSFSQTVAGIKSTITLVQDATKRNSEALGRLEKRHDEQEDKFRLSNARQNEFDGYLRTTAQTNNQAITELKGIIDPLHQKLLGISPASTESVESIAQEVQALGVKLLKLSHGPIPEDIEALKRRFETLETARPIATPKTGTSEPAGVSVSSLSNGSNTSIQRLVDVEQIVAALDASLQSLGLKKSTSKLFAEEITAAVLTNQVAIFKGAVAHLVACKCAIALSGADAWNVSIPIGLTDGRSVRAAFQDLTSKSSTNTPCIVFEGSNRSALDCTRDVFFAYTTDQLANHTPIVFCFISLVSGIASLPIEKEYLELGPVFDLDYLDWRLAPDFGVVSTSGSVAPSVLASLRSKVTQGARDDLDEVLRSVRKFMPKRNPRIERAVVAGYGALKYIRPNRGETSPMQSLAYGWLVPLGVALGLSKEDVDSELDGGKCDAQKSDLRVAAMLNQEPFASEHTDGRP